MLDIFEAGEVALGSGASPACIVSEAGQYSLAHYLARMERNPSAARQKSTLTQLLEALSYLHGRSMVPSPLLLPLLCHRRHLRLPRARMLRTSHKVLCKAQVWLSHW